MNNGELNEVDVLLAYAVEPVHDLTTLERYLRRYPQFTQELIDCSIELERDAVGEPGPAPAAMASEAAWHRFEAAMQKRPAIPVNPFERLTVQAFRALAADLNMNALFLMRLRDRAIKAASIPGLLIEALANKLEVDRAVMDGFLRGSPALADNDMQFRSAAKPAVPPQIDFKEAVRISQLTEEQQRALLALAG